MENESNKSYRIKTEVGATVTGVTIPVNLTQQYDTFEILSLKIGSEETYRLHNSNYGVVVGRVLANNGFGIPNAKLSIFIEADQDNDNAEILAIYGYTNTRETNSLGQTYNLLPDEQVNDCHQKIGAFPSKRYLLDNDVYIEVYDKYYKYTTRTNASGDYIICGVPVGNQTLHMDLDLSDCGILSQRPRDFVYKGYNIEQFENPNQFRKATGTSINSLSQYVQQTQQIYVNPLWGNSDLGETIGITRADVDVNFRFEPTCIFLGSVVSDSQSNGITKKCMATNNMGVMDELTTGKGTIEMIRKTPSGEVEEFQIKGTDLIDGNGTWCYQIPMNLDYITTDEYGNVVPTDDPERGIPTRARVRFRISFSDFDGETNTDNYFRGKMLVPNNPQINSNNQIDYDYNFGTKTTDDSFRDLLWNNVYSVKSYIPRWQKRTSWKTERFTGIKQCNFYGQNNPIPYNSIRIKMPFMFTIMCALIKSYIRIVAFINMITRFVCVFLDFVQKWYKDDSTRDINVWNFLQDATYTVVSDGLCPDLENWYFAPIAGKDGNNDFCHTFTNNHSKSYAICQQTLNACADGSDYTDKTSIDSKNRSTENEGVAETVCLTRHTDYLISCIEMNLAQEYKVIKFDFYNDWINGLIYIPRWQYRPPVKRTFLWGAVKYTTKVKGCFDNPAIYGRTVKYTQQCALGYSSVKYNGITTYSKINNDAGCGSGSKNSKRQVCHKGNGTKRVDIFGNNGGIIHAESTTKGQTVYYYKPTEIVNYKKGSKIIKKVNLYATDVILLGSLNDCSVYGVPQAFKEIPSSSFVMPTNLALTNMDEQGYLYTKMNGTFCGDGNNTLYNKDKQQRTGNTFSSETTYSSTQDGDESITQKKSDSTTSIDEYVPMTEAAGIAWNYSGPGQGDNSDDGLYTPGGHFLGISCVNTQTNIKTCLNLQRICEIGATMSERREKIRAYENGTEKYAYYVPTGFIGREEIINPSLRNMFSTLNMKPLIATKRDERTNYLIYDFLYMRSGGFDGSGSKILSKNSNYNKKVTIDTEGAAALSFDKSKDFDEINYLYRRSSEELNFGYYRFRFGVKDISSKTKASNYIESRYLVSDSGNMYLPQYENSYYFYFGLKEGSTAMDRFRSDFFSTCPIKEEEKHPRIEVIEQGINQCNLTWSTTLKIFDMTAPYSITYRFGNEDEEGTTYGQYTSDATRDFTSTTLSDFHVTVKDAEGMVLTSVLKPSAKAIDGISAKLYDFRVGGSNEDGSSKEEYSISGDLYDTAQNEIKENGGYIQVNLDGLTKFGELITSYTGIYAVVAYDETTYSAYQITSKENQKIKSSAISSFKEYNNSGKTCSSTKEAYALFDATNKILRIRIPKSKTTYTLYIGYKCNNSTTYVTTVEIGTFYSFGNEIFNVFYDSRYIMYDGTNTEKFTGIKKDSALLTALTKSDYYSFRKRTRELEKQGKTITSWLLRRAFIDTTNGTQSTNRRVYCTDMSGEVTKGLVVGQPENVEGVYANSDGWKLTNIFSDTSNEYYQGYDINMKENIYPTWYMEDLSEVIQNWRNKNSEIVMSGTVVTKNVTLKNLDSTVMDSFSISSSSTNNNNFKTIVSKLENGKRYVFLCGSSTISGTSNKKYTIRIWDFQNSISGKSTELNVVENETQSFVFDVPSYGVWSLIIYAGVAGYTIGISLNLLLIRIDKVDYNILYGGNEFCSSKYIYNKCDYLIQGFRYRYSCESAKMTGATGYRVKLLDFNNGKEKEIYTDNGGLFPISGKSFEFDVPTSMGDERMYDNNFSFLIYCGAENDNTDNNILEIKNAKLELIGPSKNENGKYVICPYKLNWHIGNNSNHNDILMGSYFFSPKTQYKLTVSYHYGYNYLGNKNSGTISDFKIYFKYLNDNGSESVGYDKCINFNTKSATIEMESDKDKTVCGVCCDAGTEIIRIVIKEFKIEDLNSQNVKKLRYDTMTYDDGIVMGTRMLQSATTIDALCNGNETYTLANNLATTIFVSNMNKTTIDGLEYYKQENQGDITTLNISIDDYDTQHPFTTYIENYSSTTIGYNSFVVTLLDNANAIRVIHKNTDSENSCIIKYKFSHTIPAGKNLLVVVDVKQNTFPFIWRVSNIQYV